MVRGVVWCLLAMEIPPAGAPPGGGVRLRGNVWLSRLNIGGWCRFAQDDTWVTGAWDGGLTVGVGGMRYVGALACFALIRHWRATFPTRGKAFFGCTDAFESALKCGIEKS